MASRTRVLSILALLVLLVGASGFWFVTATANKRVNTNLFGAAIKGYDSVA